MQGHFGALTIKRRALVVEEEFEGRDVVKCFRNELEFAPSDSRKTPSGVFWNPASILRFEVSVWDSATWRSVAWKSGLQSSTFMPICPMLVMARGVSITLKWLAFLLAQTLSMNS
jgi:hypothetical protein